MGLVLIRTWETGNGVSMANSVTKETWCMHMQMIQQ